MTESKVRGFTQRSKMVDLSISRFFGTVYQAGYPIISPRSLHQKAPGETNAALYQAAVHRPALEDRQRQRTGPGSGISWG